MGTDHIVIAVVGLGVGILQGVVILMIKQLIKQIDKVCEDNDKDHSELWQRVNHHSHTDKGKVVVEEVL